MCHDKRKGRRMIKTHEDKEWEQDRYPMRYFNAFWKELKRCWQEASKYALLGPDGRELGGIMVGAGGGGRQDWNLEERISVCMNWAPPPRIPADRHLSCSCGPDWRNWPGGAPNLETPCGRGWGIAVLKTRGWVWNLHSIQMNQVHSPPRQAIRRCFSGETQGLRAKPSTSRSLGGPRERVGSPPTLPKMKFASRWAPPLGLPHWSSNELFRASPLI